MVKIAYVIVAHKLPNQLIRLVNKLNDDDTEFFLHIDKDTKPELFNYLVCQFKSYPNIHFIKRYSSKWGQMGCVKATIEGIKSIVASGVTFDHVLNLSGQDYPIKSKTYIKNFLHENTNYSFINFYEIPYPNHKHIDEWIQHWHYFWGKYHISWPGVDIFINPVINQYWNKLASISKMQRKLPMGYKPYYGLAYWCLSHDVIQYIATFCSNHPSYVNFFNHVNYPDEFFYQTLLLNSPFRTKLTNNILTFIDFSEKKAHPSILKSRDFDRLRSSNKLFARKFDMLEDIEILDKIDEITT